MRPIRKHGDNSRARGRRSASTLATPLRWPTQIEAGETSAHATRAFKFGSQTAVRAPQNANALAVRPGRSLFTNGRASFARARQFHAAFGR